MQAEKKNHMLFQIKAKTSAYEALWEIQCFSNDCTAVLLAAVCHEIGWTPNTRYLLVPLISFAFVHRSPALSDLHLTALWEEGTVLANHSSCHPDWSIFEPGASLLSLIKTANKDTDGLQPDPHPPACLKFPGRTELVWALNSCHLQCYGILWQLIHSTSKALGLDGISDEKVL